MLFRFQTKQQPQGPTHNEKQKNIKPSLDKVEQKHMTKISQGHKRITTRKILATNNKVLVRTSSLLFFKKYQQPIIKVWSVPVLICETIRYDNVPM